MARGPLREQRVLDAALAWSAINSHLDVGDFLLQHGVDVNATWSSPRAGEPPGRPIAVGT